MHCKRSELLYRPLARLWRSILKKLENCKWNTGGLVVIRTTMEESPSDAETRGEVLEAVIPTVFTNRAF